MHVLVFSFHASLYHGGGGRRQSTEPHQCQVLERLLAMCDNHHGEIRMLP